MSRLSQRNSHCWTHLFCAFEAAKVPSAEGSSSCTRQTVLVLLEVPGISHGVLQMSTFYCAVVTLLKPEAPIRERGPKMAMPRNKRGITGPLVEDEYSLPPHLRSCGRRHGVWWVQNTPKREAICTMDGDPPLNVGQDIGRLQGYLPPHIRAKSAVRRRVFKR